MKSFCQKERGQVFSSSVLCSQEEKTDLGFTEHRPGAKCCGFLGSCSPPASLGEGEIGGCFLQMRDIEGLSWEAISLQTQHLLRGAQRLNHHLPG